jgi:hypothetical protein
MQASIWNLGTHAAMSREKIKRQEPQDKSTDAQMGADRVVVVQNPL